MSTKKVSNKALEDIQQLHEERPELPPEEWAVVEKASPWLKSVLRPEVRAELEAEYAERYAKDLKDLQDTNAAEIKRMMNEWKEAQKPLDKNDLQLLLSQEYLTFEVPIVPIRKSKKEKIGKREFTLVELPKEAEGRLISVFQRRFIPVIEKFNAMKWTFKILRLSGCLIT